MIRPKGGTKRLQLAKFKLRHKPINRRTVTHRPVSTSTLKYRENRLGRLFNQDWKFQSIPTHHHFNSPPRFLCNKERFRLATIVKREWQPRKEIVSRKGRERIQMIQDTNRVNSLQHIDRMLLSYKMKMLNNLNKTTPGSSTSTRENVGKSGKTSTSKKGIVPNQNTLKQLRQIVQKHMQEVKGGPNIRVKSSTGTQKK